MTVLHLYGIILMVGLLAHGGQYGPWPSRWLPQSRACHINWPRSSNFSSTAARLRTGGAAQDAGRSGADPRRYRHNVSVRPPAWPAATKLAARDFLHSETILSSFRHLCLSTPSVAWKQEACLAATQLHGSWPGLENRLAQIGHYDNLWLDWDWNQSTPESVRKWKFRPPAPTRRTPRRIAKRRDQKAARAKHGRPFQRDTHREIRPQRKAVHLDGRVDRGLARASAPAT